MDVEDLNQPATKADVAAVGDTLRAEMAEMRIELRTEIRETANTLRDELIEVLRDSETKLLNAFYALPSPIRNGWRRWNTITPP